MIPGVTKIKVAGALASKFMGGGAGYVILGLTAYSAFLGWQNNQSKARAADFEAKLKTAQTAIAGKSSALVTQAAQNDRGQNLNTAEDNARDKINAKKDSFNCAQSEPIIASLDWLREYGADARKPDHNDSTNVPLQRPARDAK